MSKETLFLVAPESWRVPAGMPRDCMLWEAYSKATVVLYMHKYNDIYLLYLYMLIFKPKQCRSKRQWCQRHCPGLCACPQWSRQEWGRGAVHPPPSLGCSSRSAGRCVLLACARPWLPVGPGVSKGSDPTRASVSLGERRVGTEVCCTPGAAGAGGAPSLQGGQASSRVLPSSVPLESRRGCGAGQ